MHGALPRDPAKGDFLKKVPLGILQKRWMAETCGFGKGKYKVLALMLQKRLSAPNYCWGRWNVFEFTTIRLHCEKRSFSPILLCFFLLKKEAGIQGAEPLGFFRSNL